MFCRFWIIVSAWLLTFSIFVPVDSQPDTQELDRSEIRTQILLATASSHLKNKHSFTHMLNQVRDTHSNTRTQTIYHPINTVSVILLYNERSTKQCLVVKCAIQYTVWQIRNIMLYDASLCLCHSESRVAVVDPVFLMGNAVVFAHSEFGHTRMRSRFYL